MNSDDANLTRVVGLAYEPGQGLPKVVLKGSGAAADEIVEQGRRQTVPVVNDEQLLDALFRLPTDAEIGPDLFHLVAALLVHVYAVDRQMKEDRL